MTRPLFCFGGWFNLAYAALVLASGNWWYGIALLGLSAFLLSIGYRVAAVFGIRLPWVRDDQDH